MLWVLLQEQRPLSSDCFSKLKPGDEIITQAFTFVATVEAIVESNCKPICANIDDT